MKLAVIGVGLIGGSFALGLKKAKAVSHVVGIGRSAANLKLAQERGIVDSVAGDPGDAEVVLVAAPVGQYARIFSSLSSFKGIVTDAGSTKRDVVALGRHLPRFVPGHPIAGAEKSGAAAASADLFRDRRVILTPLKESEDVSRVRKLWEACGARVSTMTAEEHDEVLAAVSHLPHLLASGWCTRSRSERTPSSFSPSPPAVSAISPASPPATRRCGAISVSPTRICFSRS